MEGHLIQAHADLLHKAGLLRVTEPYCGFTILIGSDLVFAAWSAERLLRCAGVGPR